VKPIEVLLVQQNAGDIRLIRQALKEEPFPITVQVATDGKQAVQMLAARNSHPDLVILEMDLPKMHGLSVLECTSPYVPVVVFTSSSSAEDRRAAFQLGVVEYIQKPSDLQEFAGVVSQIVRNWTMPEPRTLKSLAAC
jgi:CheY-like chemotaxis protein